MVTALRTTGRGFPHLRQLPTMSRTFTSSVAEHASLYGGLVQGTSRWTDRLYLREGFINDLFYGADLVIRQF